MGAVVELLILLKKYFIAQNSSILTEKNSKKFTLSN